MTPPATTDAPAARVEDLTKVYGKGDTGVTALAGVTVDIARLAPRSPDRGPGNNAT